jgi:hypothetical protein
MKDAASRTNKVAKSLLTINASKLTSVGVFYPSENSTKLKMLDRQKQRNPVGDFRSPTGFH